MTPSKDVAMDHSEYIVMSLASTGKDSYWLDNPHWTLEFALVFFRKWLLLFILPIGVFGNVASLLITTKKDNRRISTCAYMSGLAVFDTLHLLVMGVIAILNHGVANHLANIQLVIRYGIRVIIHFVIENVIPTNDAPKQYHIAITYGLVKTDIHVRYALKNFISSK
jgi:hypothetical protein